MTNSNRPTNLFCTANIVENLFMVTNILKGLAQAKIIKKSVILFWLFNMNI